MKTLEDLLGGRVEILYEGEWREDQLKIEIDKKCLQLSPEIIELAKKRFEERKKENPRLFNGRAFHLCSIEKRGDKLFLVMVPINYSLFDIARPEYRHLFPPHLPFGPVGVGVSSVTLTSDDQLLLQKRAGWVDRPGKIGLIGGACDEKNPFRSMKKELEEEAGVKRRQIKDIRVIAILLSRKEKFVYELVFLTMLTIPKKQVVKQVPPIEQSEGKIFFLPWHPKIMRTYLKKHFKKIPEHHIAGILAGGRYYWGKDWSQI